LSYVIFPESKQMTVQKMGTIQNDMGEIIPDWIDDYIISGEIWPLQGNYKRNEMGVTEKSTHKLFTTDAVKSNTLLIADSGVYLTGYVQDWGTHREVILELVL